MKKNLLIFFAFSLIACSDDISIQGIDEKQVAEIPVEGLKIRLKESENTAKKFTTEFFYNKNGFIDSIHTIKHNIVSEKFIYNDFNQIVEVRTFSKNTNENDYSIKNKTFYKYNKINQIISLETFNKNNILSNIQNYTYNNDGTLYNPVKIVENENLINENSSNGYTTYKYDSYRNPYYNIYPKAYKVLNYINKNNIKLIELKTAYQNLQWSYDLSYNDDKYVWYEIIQNYQNGYEYNKFHYYP